MVRLLPSLIVPPICPGLCSGISITCQGKNATIVTFIDLIAHVTVGLFLHFREITTGCFDSGSNSVEFASGKEQNKANRHAVSYIWMQLTVTPGHFVGGPASQCRQLQMFLTWNNGQTSKILAVLIPWHSSDNRSSVQGTT